MGTAGKRNRDFARVAARILTSFITAAWIAASLSGCASGSFSSTGSGTTTTTTTASSNPPSLPPLAAATPVNTYVGTQAPGSSIPENLVSLNLNQNAASYTYSNIALPGTAPNSVANSMGGYAPWIYYDALGDVSDQTGAGPGPQYYGLALEEPSRFAFAAPGTASQQLAAMVPQQTSGCITPTTAATYQYVTLFGANFAAATDAAWGTVQLSPGFSFTGAKQYTETSQAATTGLIPFAVGSCVKSASEPGLGYFIDTPAAPQTGNTEMRAFLGPTGLLAANLQGNDSDGNPLPLPGVLAMAQPSSPIDVAAVAGSLTNELVYRTFVYQPASSGVQFGFFGHDPLTHLQDMGFDSFLTSTGTTGFFGGWQSVTTTSTPLSASQGIVFGAQDPNNPGLFPNAKFLYEIGGDPAYDIPCPSGTESFAHGYNTQGYGYAEICSSPAVVMIAQHDGKYLLLATGIYVPANSSPTVMILVQE